MLICFYIRSVMNFVHLIASTISDGFGKMTLSTKLCSKIAWIAEKKVQGNSHLEI